MATEQVIMSLSNALTMVILASLVLAVGLGILSGLIWLYLWLGRKILVLLHNMYNEAIKPLTVVNGKKQTAKG